jgi:hypothetical protein
MSVKQRLLLGVVAILALASVASAQNYQPFIEAGYFDHDLQFFAPADDIDVYADQPVQKTGWFGSYDRMYLWITRPLPEPSYTEGDMTWGNRMDIGYMIDGVDHDHGWLLSWMHIDGPNSFDHTHQERINRVNEDDTGATPPTSGGGSTTNDQVVPPADRNNVGPPDSERFYDLRNSLNYAKLFSIELNKIFRMEPLNHGGLLEPFFGFRYMHFQDWRERQHYLRYNEDGVVVPGPIPGVPPPAPPPAFTDGQTEDLITDLYCFDNKMLGGQLGLRWAKRVSRWNLSSETRAFALQNFQTLNHNLNVTRTYYDGGGTGAQVDGIMISVNDPPGGKWWHATNFVPGLDIRAEAAYEVTRDIQLHVGCQFLGLFQGLGRGDNIAANNQDVIIVGTTFGFVVNR